MKTTNGRTAALRLAAALAIASAAAYTATADTWQPLEQWRIDGARIAPWAPAGTQVDPAYRGREVRFEVERVAGPEPIVCDDPTYEWIFGEAAGLFEGGLPEPQTDAARQLGLGPEPIATLRVTCANAGFDFHRTADSDLLLGLDNVVWTLRAARAAQTPAEIVQELLIVHFTHDMGFTPESVALKSEFLSADLRQRILRYFSAPQPPDEVPAIAGDPFTDSQEYPDRFTLGPVRTESARTVVPVNFPLMQRRVDYVLVTEDGRWVLDDLVDERGGSLRELLDGGDPAEFAAFLARFRAALAGLRLRPLHDRVDEEQVREEKAHRQPENGDADVGRRELHGLFRQVQCAFGRLADAVDGFGVGGAAFA